MVPLWILKSCASACSTNKHSQAFITNFSHGALLTPLCRLDQYHYHGTEAVDVFIARCNVTKDDHVLEVGSGIGGPSRYTTNNHKLQMPFVHPFTICACSFGLGTTGMWLIAQAAR